VTGGGSGGACGGSGGGGWGGGGGGGWWVGAGAGSSRTTGFLSSTVYGENARGVLPGGSALAPNYTSFPAVGWGGAVGPVGANSTSGGPGAVVLTLCFSCPAGSFPSPGGPLTFAHTGASVNFSLPLHTTAVHVSLWGAGASMGQNVGYWGGGGAHVAGWLAPTPPPLSTLVLVVGGGGVYSSPTPRLGGAPFEGFGSFPGCSGTGAGASAVGVVVPGGGAATVMAVAGGGGAPGQWASGGAARWDGFAPLNSPAGGSGRGSGAACGSPNGIGGAAASAGAGGAAGCGQTTYGAAGRGPYRLILNPATGLVTAGNITTGGAAQPCGGVGGGGYFGGGGGGWWV
jgi:hypothetical protein